MTTPPKSTTVADLLRQHITETQYTNHLLTELLARLTTPAPAAQQQNASTPAPALPDGIGAKPTAGGLVYSQTKNGNGWTAIYPDMLGVSGEPVRLTAVLNRRGWGATAFDGDGQVDGIGWLNGNSADECLRLLIGRLAVADEQQQQASQQYAPPRSAMPDDDLIDVDDLPF